MLAVAKAATMVSMDFSDYYLVPVAHRATVAKLFDAKRVAEHDAFVAVITDDDKRIAKVPVAMHFHNDEWSAWGFTVLENGKAIAHGLFGENAETGVSLDDNVLEGDLDLAARLLGVERTRFHEAVETEDVETFVNLLDVPLMSITPSLLARELGAEAKTKAKAKAKPKPEPKAKTKTKAKAKAKAKPKPKPKAKAAKRPAPKQQPAPKQAAAKKVPASRALKKAAKKRKR